MGGYADIFYRNAKFSVVLFRKFQPQGTCAGGAVYSVATDFTIMVENTLHVCYRTYVKTVTNRESPKSLRSQEPMLPIRKCI
ncbi:MAG: carboxyl transferase domain-containing protein [Saprospiraceae bacterium]